MASITRNASGNWKAIVRRKGWPPIIKTFRAKRDAKDWARTTEDEIIRGIYIRRIDSERTTIDEALTRYLAEVSPGKSPSSHHSDTRKAKTLREHLGTYSLAAVTPALVAEFRDQRLAAGLANNSVRLELALLSHLYTIAIREWGLGLAMNPVANVRKPSPGNGRNRRLAPDEEQRLFEELDRHSNPMLAWVARIALSTAMRQGEILSLRRQQVDLLRRVVRLQRSKNGDSRTVPLSQTALAAFHQAMEHAANLDVSSPLLFFGEPGRDGRRRPYVMQKVWADAVRRAGIEDFRFHDLRHEAVSRLVEAGLTDQQVATISGHRSMQMLKRYTHLRGEDLVEELDRALH